MRKLLEHEKAVSQLRDALLALHKTLIDSERVGYEETFGAISSPNEFLRLLLNDPWFTWLRPLSGFVSALDEALDDKEPMTVEQAGRFVVEAKALLTPSEQGEGFARHYFIAIQRDPDVVLAHANVTRLHR